MTPPQLHMSLEVLLSAGMLAIKTVGEPGAHGAAVTGMQGMGVSTPNAAAVAAATIGFAMLLHMPNGGTLTMGLLSMMLAAGVPLMTLFAGRTTSVDGATPKLHCIMAPMHTRLLIVRPLPFPRLSVSGVSKGQKQQVSKLANQSLSRMCASVDLDETALDGCLRGAFEFGGGSTFEGELSACFDRSSGAALNRHGGAAFGGKTGA